MTPLPPEERYTYADALTWDEDEHIELIYGQPVMMAPPSRAHQKILKELTRQLANYLSGKQCEVYPAPFGVRLFEQKGDDPEDVDTLVEPDISVVCDPSKLDDAGCKGAPEIIMEILSPSTQRHDRMVKYRLYQTAGVQEYWIVDPDTHTVAVHLLQDGRYGSPDIYAGSTVVPVAVLNDCKIELSSVF